ncbi:MAG: RimK family alpha-L-glutamate ligase [Chitinophagales bacterium]
MQQFDIVLLTEDRYYEPPVITDYISNILLDDKMLTAELEALGLTVTRKSWSDPEFDWASARFAIFRTIWDYFKRYDEFNKWLNIAEANTSFINSIELVRWNIDKHYFIDLNNKGVHTVETIFIEKHDDVSLETVFNHLQNEQAILKPAVSGAAWHTYKINKNNIADHEAIFKQLISEECMLLQPFQNEIIEKGEVAMMVMGGIFTHAVLKKAKPGDFRVQDDFGGTLHDYTPTKEEIAFAEKAVLACSTLPLYARVDIIRDNNDELSVMELEIIEPELWLRRFPEAAKILAGKIREYTST